VDAYWKRYIRHIKNPESLGEIRWNKTAVESYARQLLLETRITEDQYTAFLDQEKAARYIDEDSTEH
jgi:phosphoribosylamine-glycine ligase